jgi:hypothetical protein
MNEPLYRTEEYDYRYESVTISADWDYASDACRSFVQLLLGHGMSPDKVSTYVHKAKADFEAGANIIEVTTGTFKVSLERLSKIGHPAERKDNAHA